MPARNAVRAAHFNFGNVCDRTRSLPSSKWCATNGCDFRLRAERRSLESLTSTCTMNTHAMLKKESQQALT